MEATHTIVFHDGSKKFINQPVYDAIWKDSMSGKKQIAIGGNLISFSAIAKLLSLKDYYAEYPKERPPRTEYKQLPAYGLLGTVERFKDKDYALKGMIKGLKRFIDRENPPENGKSRELLKQMEFKLTNF